MSTVRTLIGYVKGPKGDKGDTGATGAQGPAGQNGAPGVTDYATTEAAGLVRVGDDFNINSSNGILSIKNVWTKASTLAAMVSGEAFSTALGKIAKAVDAVVTIAEDYLKSTDIVDSLTSSLTNKALSANKGKELKDGLDSLNDSLTVSYVGNIESAITGATPSISNIVRVGKSVNFGLRFGSLSYSSTSRTTIATIPSDFRPLGQRFCIGYLTIGSTRYPSMFLIYADGTIRYDPFSSGTVVQIEVCGSYMI